LFWQTCQPQQELLPSLSRIECSYLETTWHGSRSLSRILTF
jgi:hypothetical protein